MQSIILCLSALALVAADNATQPPRGHSMNLGNFSVSLTVKDIGKSKAFYEQLGFVQIHGETEQGWAIMRSGDTKIGLFQGMFERNMLTFNPRWDKDGKPDPQGEDIRAIHKRLKEAGMDVGPEISGESGPANFTIADPDGNPILFDQHL